LSFIIFQTSPESNNVVVIGVQPSSVWSEGDKSPRDMKSVCLEAGAMFKGCDISSSQSADKNNDQKLENNIKSNHTFSPQDLFALVKNLEFKININEGNLI